MEREIIMCDADDVLLDYMGAFTNFLKDKGLKLNLSDYEFGIGKEKVREYVSEFRELDEFAELEHMDNKCQKLFNELAKKYMMIIVTACRLEEKEKREENLKGFNYDYIYYVPNINKPRWVKENIGECKCCIDDNPKNIKGFIDLGYVTYAPQLQYNGGISGCIYYKDWQELFDRVKNEK
jgi:hypothetical protein